MVTMGLHEFKKYLHHFINYEMNYLGYMELVLKRDEIQKVWDSLGFQDQHNILCDEDLVGWGGFRDFLPKDLSFLNIEKYKNLYKLVSM